MSQANNKQIKIAIDGPAGAGKSSVAREIARRLGFKYLDTGAMYRAITLKMIREKVDLDDPRQVEEVLNNTQLDVKEGNIILLDGEDVTAEIRKPYVNNMVSPVSAIPAVRRRLVQMQQEIAARSGGIIMEGRDITTRVMPEADFKFYLDASLMERARRRMKEQLAAGILDSLEEVAEEIRRRDRIDSQRADSPLCVAPGATVIDTTDLSFEEVVNGILLIIASS